MRPLVLDKVASVTANCALGREVRIGDEFPCREGDVVAVRILTEKHTYNLLELTTGRMSLVKRGDVLVGALGHRMALSAYAGHVPETLAVGDTIQVLNLGGVLGVCDAFNPDIGRPFDAEVLGQVLHFPYLGERIGEPANIGQGALPMRERLDTQGVPVVMVVGTCMNSGKTFACASLVQEFCRAGLEVHALKATGVSLKRDVLAMEDAGASRTMLFTDLGVATTTDANAPALTRSMITTLAEERPDVIVVELGDGLLGTYGVHAILDDAEIREHVSALVLAANDPVGAWGGLRRLEECYGIRTTVVTGPTTDNVAGTKIIEEQMGTPAKNARVSPRELADVVLAAAGLERRDT